MLSSAGAPGARAGPAASGAFIIAALASEKAVLEREALRSACPGVTLRQSGPGAAAAARAAAAAVAGGAEALVSWGLAGALVAAARPGGVVIPRRILGAGFEPLTVNAEWRGRLIAACTPAIELVDGDLVGVPGVLVSPAEKASLGATFGAVAADMESRAIAEVAASAGIPFVAVRVVADAVGDALPVDIEACVTPAGAVACQGVVQALLRRPADIALFVRLGRRSAVAHRVLGELARALCSERFGLPVQESVAGPAGAAG